MTQELARWVAKAEGDFTTAKRELPQIQDPNYDAVCYLSQQCVEKYLKGYLVYQNASFPKVHDLPFLLKLVVAYVPHWHEWEDRFHTLTQLAGESRYPGELISKARAELAFEICETFRAEARKELGL